MRQRNTTSRGTGFDQAAIDAIWTKAQTVGGYDPAQHRKDSCGAWITKAEHGKTTDYGWEIDHFKPVAKGGGDDLSNLQPLHWENNRHKGDSWPNWDCYRR